MKVLVACEFSGTVRDAFCRAGHDAWSCDLLPTERPGNHIQGDVLRVINDGWDMMIAHPPCTHLAVSGSRWFKNKAVEQREALEFFLKLLNAPIRQSAVENPVSVASSFIRKPDQIVQPWQYGHGETKATCFWLRNLPPSGRPGFAPAGKHEFIRNRPARTAGKTAVGLCPGSQKRWHPSGGEFIRPGSVL